MGADAVSIGTAALIALGCNSPKYQADYEKLGTSAGFFDDYQDGRDPTQDPALATRLNPVEDGLRLANYLRVLTLETQTIARACGRSHVHNFEPEDLVAPHDRIRCHGEGPTRRDELDSRRAGKILAEN